MRNLCTLRRPSNLRLGHDVNPKALGVSTIIVLYKTASKRYVDEYLKEVEKGEVSTSVRN